MNSIQIFSKTHTFGDVADCFWQAFERVLLYVWHRAHAVDMRWITWGVISFMCAANAMTVQRVGSDVFVSGVIERHDDRLLRAEFARGEVKRLILVNSPGGDLPAGMAMARWLQGQGVTTLVVGQCLSACSLLFMAGQERQYATGVAPHLTVVGIHGPSMPFTGALVPERAREMWDYYQERMGAKFDAQLLTIALYQMQDASGFVLIREMDRNRPRDRITLHCPTARTPREQCAEYAQKDAFTLGVVTASSSVVLDLPDNLQIRMP
jgi:ATP-dependent protease ClpP protease subunit